MSSIRPFANEDGYTPFSNYTLDVIMPSLPANAWKVLCFVLRKTQGWQKDMDRLSYGQIEEGTGISSSATISTAIKVLLEKNYIIQVPGSAWKPMGYRINSALEIEEQETTDSTSIPEEQKTNSTSKSKAHSTSKIKVTSEIEPHSDLKIEADSTSIFKDTTERSTEKEQEHARSSRKRSDVHSSDEEIDEPISGKKTPQVIRQALYDTCQIADTASREVKLNANSTAKRLWQAGNRQGKSDQEIADAIRYVGSWCRKGGAWQCKDGSAPTPKLIGDYWRQAIEARDKEKSRASPPPPYVNGTNGTHDTGKKTLTREQLATLAAGHHVRTSEQS